jgi:hypothetical protein
MNQPGAAPAPRKLFREDASTSSIKCHSCGGPITLKGFGNVQRVNCPYCGSTMEPQPNGALTLLQQAQRQRRQSLLPLHARGTIDKTLWEIIGIVWREARVDGIAYPWQEFLCFNPYKGFRWLVYQMTDGHWMFGGSLDGAPQAKGGFGSHRSVSYKGKDYRHFQSSPAYVTYVEGEFTWQVQVGDSAMANDYVAPPFGVSIEQSESDDGAELNFTQMRHIDGKEVWKAFGVQGSPPAKSGVGMLAPNPHKPRNKWYGLAFVVLFLAWLGTIVVYTSGREKNVVYQERDLPINVPITKEVEFGEPGKTGTLEFSFSGAPLSNGWAYASVLLVNTEKEEGLNFGAEIDNWNGVADGESYNEGTNPRTVTIGGIEGGKYLLQIDAQVDPKAKTPPATMNVKLTEDVVLWRYILIPFLIIMFGPFFHFGLNAAFEGRRWKNSDHANTGE